MQKHTNQYYPPPQVAGLNDKEMSYHNEGRKIKDTEHNKIIAVATYDVGAEIIV